AASEFQVKRTAVPGFISVSKINFERDKGSTGAATSTAGALDNSLLSDELVDELTAANSLLTDETLVALSDGISLARKDETVAATEEDADDTSIVVCASELSATASTNSLVEAVGAAIEETSDAETCNSPIDEDCAVSVTADILLAFRLLTSVSLTRGTSVCAETENTQQKKRRKTKADGILLIDS
ncbi:MAG TPA: hypothetical protein VGE32_07675, partial [Cellvibrio sp.]